MARPTHKGWGPLLEDPIPGDVLKCCEELGIEILRVVEDEAHGHCPAHIRLTGKVDRHPSWSVNLESGEHNCFSCGFRGPFVSLVRESLGCSLEDAVLWTKARGSIDRAKKILFGRGQYINELTEVEEITEADLALFVEVPQWAADERDLDVECCNELGVLWDAKKDYWITPIRDPYTGQLWGWQEKGQTNRFFRNRPNDVKKSKTLFGIQQVTTNTAILVESPLDTVRLRTAGLGGGVSSFGARVSDTQLDLLVDAEVEYLVSALDNDNDGIKANDDLRTRTRGRLRLSFFNYGLLDAKDPGDMTDEQIWEAYETAYSSILWKRA